MRYEYPFASKDFLSVYEKGGGGYVPPPPDHTLEVQQMKQEHDDKVAAQAKQDALDAKNAATTRGQQLLTSGYEGGLSKARATLGMKGLDANSGYGSDIMRLLTSDYDNARTGADPSTVTNAGSIYLPSMFDNEYQAVRGTQKAKLQNSVNEFAGSGFANNMVKDTDDSSILDSILGDQFTDAQNNLQRAFARGQINDAGMAYGTKELGKQQLSGRSKASDLASGVLSGYRQQLTDYTKPWQSRLDNFDLTDNFDPSQEQSGLNALNTSLHGRMQGDILNAIGGTNFFDTDTLLANAGQRSGAINSPSSSGFGGLSGGSLGAVPSMTSGSGAGDGLLTTPLNTKPATATDPTKTNTGF